MKRMYETKENLITGKTVYYIHDKRKIEKSSYIKKIVLEGIEYKGKYIQDYLNRSK